jgi:hypothetical protein
LPPTPPSTFTPGEVSVTPGVKGEFAVARWTAPADGDYEVDVKFRGTGMFTTTDLHVLVAKRLHYIARG